jgi:hypothetical protein
MLASRSASTVQEKLAVLNCRRLPGRLNIAEVAVLLGFKEHDIPILIAARLLNPLGKPAQNAPKFFASMEILQLGENREWLVGATKAVAKHWRARNSDNRMQLTTDNENGDVKKLTRPD